MRRFIILASFLLNSSFIIAQFSRDSIYSGFVLYQRRVSFEKYMHEKTIAATFEQPLNSTTEDNYREACWAISQFVLQSGIIEKGFYTLFNGYSLLQPSTKRAFLEAVYATYSTTFIHEIQQLAEQETIPKLFAIQTIYLFRADDSNHHATLLQQQLHRQFNGFDTVVVLNELDKYLLQHNTLVTQSTPSIQALFDHQKNTGQKMIYSFQRWNRDYPGLAIVQNADGHFCRDEQGRLLVFQQLARSASDLPYFITNGSTPQGIFSIQGTAISQNNLIGPTPNIQMVMPFEADSLFWHTPADTTKDALTNYLNLLPESWRSYAPMTEAFYAGKAGRSEIIAHGTTIDPDYYKDKPYYPLTPTMGCLCAKETWNIFNGKITRSDQFNLVNTFLSTPGNTGYLMVINLDNNQKAVSREEVEKMVGLL